MPPKIPFLKTPTTKNATGEMFFGGVNGLTVFHPDEITLNENIPPVCHHQFFMF